LRIEVGMQVDEAGAHHVAFRVDLLLAAVVDRAKSRDQTVVDCDVSRDRFGPAPVHDSAAADYDVMCHWVPRRMSIGRRRGVVASFDVAERRSERANQDLLRARVGLAAGPAKDVG
jgi:hypothetical protein